jgi:acetyl-CoA acyltransferase
MGARTIRLGEAEMVIAGGVESMSRAPFVMPKAGQAFSRQAEIYDTTIGWRFVNPVIKAQYGVDSMPETGENVAEEYQVTRADQDAFALRSQQRAGRGARQRPAGARDRRRRAPAARARRRSWTPTSIPGRRPRSRTWPGSARRSATTGR